MQINTSSVSAPMQFHPALHLPAQNDDRDDQILPPRPRQVTRVIGPPLPPPGQAGPSRVVTYKGANHAKWHLTSVSEMENSGYVGVDFNRLRAAINVPSQSDAGEYRSICCGPNSIARAAVMMGRSVGDVNALYRNFRYNGIGAWRFGPDPLQMKEALEKDNAFRGIGVAATRVDKWGDILAQLEWHVAHAKTPFMALFVYSQMSMHWVNIVALSPDRQSCVMLDTDGSLYRLPMEELHALLQKDRVTAPVLSKLNGVRFFP